MADVYVVDVDSEDRDRLAYVCVSKTLKAAVEAVKAKYGKPYVVEWGEVVKQEIDGKSRWLLEGKFAHVPHYTIEHKATFRIRVETVV